MKNNSNSPYTYQAWLNEALLEVGKKIIKTVETNGLYQNIHFYISFKTTCPLVKIPPFLKDKYPHIMTIVLQNQFYDLKCEKEGFSVTLYFNSKPTTLFISWKSIVQILDPVTPFSLPIAKNENTKTSTNNPETNKTKIIKFPKP